MQTPALTAGLLLVLTGLVHSVLGEILIFRQVRERGIVPTRAPSPLKERHLRILWATWHVVTLLGWGFAALLLRIGAQPDAPLATLLLTVTAATSGAAGVLVLFATRARHPGWIALTLAGTLAGIAAAS
ncbi:MAG TPA: hypothetical protein VLF18_18890 [Tahibacter sp.]|uniref:hypothetical protein n=1 Tax=Tahibacter sp. TaxID=2056211 RepID=UPI002BB3AE5C|nr:hypothetical protein [Tahibacter sp.]HSX62255.1 hypothetical protein [Tahibacter sp.]